MAFSSTISSKGQVTIPIEVRRRLGLKEGARVHFVEKNGKTILEPAQDPDPFKKYMGILAGHGPSTIAEIVREERILRGHEPEPPPGKRKRRRSG